MTPEMWTTVVVGVAILAVVVPVLLHLSKRIDDQGQRLARLEGMFQMLFQPRPVAPPPSTPVDDHDQAA